MLIALNRTNDMRACTTSGFLTRFAKVRLSHASRTQVSRVERLQHSVLSQHAQCLQLSSVHTFAIFASFYVCSLQLNLCMKTNV